MSRLSLALSDGSLIPQIAYGLYLVPPEDVRPCVRAALSAGYRHFDSAAFYANEAELGAALAEAAADGLVDRDELFLTTKVWTTDATFDDAVASIERSYAELNNLNDTTSTDGAAAAAPPPPPPRPISLALVHWPVPGGAHIKMYRALQQCHARGLVARLGLSVRAPAAAPARIVLCLARACGGRAIIAVVCTAQRRGLAWVHAALRPAPRFFLFGAWARRGA